ncbi:MAG TPA: hypothetical protein PLP29_05600 [Candidatus Ozemobacteraceae bacterium]|nr:hypothetical protein [Candidatus Ozemobacteraceae bacterium]
MNTNLLKSLGLAVLLVIAGSLTTAVRAETADSDPRYKRDGEVYLLIGKNSATPVPGQKDYRGVWRLSDPEGIFNKGSFPQYLIGKVDIQDISVDLQRNIFTLSAPNQNTIGAGFKIKRQVLDDSVTKQAADRGCHSYIHMDHRGAYWGYNTDVYRTGPVGRGILSGGGGSTWSGFKSAGPGVLTSEPPNPTSYLPAYKNTKLQLEYYPGKKWYEIPNGAWYSSWKYVKGCGWFYQVFADLVTGTQYDWTLYKWAPNTTATVYSQQAGNTFATTYDMSIKRATLAGCLDGCGGASGNEAIKSDKMVFSSAFMPVVDKFGNTTSRTYFYSRPEGKSGYSISTTGPGSTNYVLKGDPVGFGAEAPDSQWLGVSMRDANSDYLYCLGNSVIKNWIKTGGGNDAGVKVSAVAVSNQWSQKGGIVFAFDETEKMVYKFERDEMGSHKNSAFPISSILGAIGASANSKIEDIKADGDGNLYIGLTYPGTKLTPAEITAKWTNNDAFTYEVADNVNDEGFQTGRLFFRQDYRKTVFRISSEGEPPREEGTKGGIVFATQIFSRELSITPEGWKQLKESGPMPNAGIAPIVASWTTSPASGSIGPFVLSEYAAGNDPGQCRIAVINIPKPPDVNSLRDKLSFLDIIGAYRDKIPVYDPNERSTNQNTATRHGSPLSTRVLYFYMVENYPVPTGAQNPTVNPDYDGDGRQSGFVSTLKDPNPSTATPVGGSVRYYWQTWMVEDKDKHPVCPPEPMSEQGAAGSYFHWFYTPIKGKFIVTCRVDYDWYDYSLLPFGTTITQFMANPGAAYKLKTKAVPSISGTMHHLSTSRLGDIMALPDFKFMTASASTYIGTILGSGENREYYAVEPVVVTGDDQPPPPPTKEIARIQRCDVAGNDPLSELNWYPQGQGVMNPSGGFHGIRVGTPYRWRMDIASQSIFFHEDLSLAKNAIDYNMLANKLMDPKELSYFVNQDPEFRFIRSGDDIRWAPNSTYAIEAYLKYPVPPLSGGKPKIVQVDLGSDMTKVPTKGFAYFTTSSSLPPTDPFEAELVIEMSRLFLYDMRIFHITNGNERLLGKVPNLPKKLTITASAKVLITDTLAPSIAFKSTNPVQLYGLAGAALTSGTNGNPTGIRFRVEDNDPWDGVPGITPHVAYTTGNIATNKTIIDNNYGKAGSANYNLKPVFNLANRGAQLSYDVAGIDAASRKVTLARNAYKPSYGAFPPGTGLPAPVVSWSEDTSNKTFRATLDYTVALSTLNNGGPIQLSKFYANNTPGYKPYEFWLKARDASGNESSEMLLNLVLHVKDDIPPDPWGFAREYKGNRTARFPGNAAITSDAQFLNQTSHSPSFISRGNWLPGDADSGRVGQIWTGGFNTGLTALWPVNDTIAALPETMGKLTTTPGNLQVEDNVELLFEVGAGDNAGAATAKLTFRYFDIDRTEKSASTGSSSFSLPGTGTGAVTTTTSSVRAVFREGSSVRFPMAIPILIEASDNALNWDSYTGCTYAPNGTWSWNPATPTKGSSAPNKRTFRTTLPVFGSELNIRTIERGVRSPGN